MAMSTKESIRRDMEKFNNDAMCWGVENMMIFFKCAMKQEKKMCSMAQMYSWYTTLYGNTDDFNWSQFGLPQDKYDRAALTAMVETESQSKEDEFINDFFTNDEL